MYSTVQHARSSTRVVGVAMTGLMVAGAGWVFGNALIREYIAPPPTQTELVILTPETLQEVLPLPPEVEEIEIAEAPPLLAPPVPVMVENPVMVAPPAPVVPVVMTTPAPVLVGSDRAMPKLRSTDKPPYPSQSIRAQEEGTTRLAVCVGANGRVSSASVAASSGHPRLDDAAAKWVRSARFTPGSVGGRAQSMCGHNVYYEWNLDDA